MAGFRVHRGDEVFLGSRGECHRSRSNVQIGVASLVYLPQKKRPCGAYMSHAKDVHVLLQAVGYIQCSLLQLRKKLCWLPQLKSTKSGMGWKRGALIILLQNRADAAAARNMLLQHGAMACGTQTVPCNMSYSICWCCDMQHVSIGVATCSIQHIRLATSVDVTRQRMSVPCSMRQDKYNYDQSTTRV